MDLDKSIDLEFNGVPVLFVLLCDVFSLFVFSLFSLFSFLFVSIFFALLESVRVLVAGSMLWCPC